MGDRQIRYVIHIGTTAGALWNALTDAEVLKKNWGRIESSWAEGAEVTEVDEAGKVLWKGKVLRNDAPRLLSYTMDVAGMGEPPTEIAMELSRPETEVAPDAPVVRLVLTQTGFPESSRLFTGCARAWPEILSSIKTYVETGRPLPFRWTH